MLIVIFGHAVSNSVLEKKFEFCDSLMFYQLKSANEQCLKLEFSGVSQR